VVRPLHARGPDLHLGESERVVETGPAFPEDALLVAAWTTEVSEVETVEVAEAALIVPPRTFVPKHSRFREIFSLRKFQ